MTQPKIDHFEAVRGPANAPGTGPDDSIKAATVDGVSCYAFTVKPGDVQIWDRAAGNAGGSGEPNERAEISYAPAPDTEKFKSPYNVREGMTQTYDVDYRFKAGWPTHDPAQHAWAVLTQFHQQPSPKGIPGFGGATIRGNAIVFYNPNGDGNFFASVSIVPESWIKLRMAVKWSAGNDGYAVVQGRTTGALIGRFPGPTIAPGEWKYLKQGYYRAGGLPEGTVYQTLVDINDGDLTATAPAPAKGKNSAPLDPSKPSVQPNDGAAALISVRDQLVALKDSRLQPQIDAVNKLLDNGAWTP